MKSNIYIICSEEGARFPISMMSSAVWAGKIPLEKAHNLKEVGGGGRTVKQELERIGYLGEMEASYKAMPLGAHFELHIGMYQCISISYALTSMSPSFEAQPSVTTNFRFPYETQSDKCFHFVA